MKTRLLNTTAALIFSATTAMAQTPTLLKDTWPGGSSGMSGGMYGAIINGYYYFFPRAGSYGVELFKTDGTTINTNIVKDMNVGSGDGAGFGPCVVFNNVLYYVGSDGTGTSSELYRSDGTSGGTYLVKDICTDSYQSDYINNFTVYNNSLFFSANTNAVQNTELFKTDGTAVGTVMVKDINPGTGSSVPHNFIQFNGGQFFVASNGTNGYELWKTDGTSGGTFMVKDIRPGSSDCFTSNYIDGAIMGNYLYFFANNGVNGNELWRSDGTNGGTTLVKDIYPGATESVDSYNEPSSFTVFKNNGYFLANNGTSGRELWKTDGTTGGTVLLKDIYSGSSSAGTQYSYIVNAQDVRMFLNVTDGVNGNEVWVSDGTSGGTVMAKDIRTGSTGSLSSNSNPLTVFGNLYFVADNGSNGYELWKSDGTSGGTAMLKDANPGTIGSNLGVITMINGIGYYSCDNGTNGYEVWRTDLTSGGTYMLPEINPGSAGSGPGGYLLVGSKIIFSAFDATNGAEIWVMGSVTGIDEKETSSFNIYPNPFGSSLTIDCGSYGEKSGMEVFNMIGEKVDARMLANGSNQVDLSTLKAGVYFVRISNNDQVITQKVVKQ